MTTDASITVLLADDQNLIRSAVADLVSHEPGLDVVGQASNGQEAYDLARRHRPDVVLMDVRMPEMDGIRATELISANPELEATRIIILTTFEEDAYVFQALKAGASGFLGKGTDPADLMTAIRTVHAGEALLSPRATRTLITRFLAHGAPSGDPSVTPVATGPVAARTTTEPHIAAEVHATVASLTVREMEVLRLVARGKSNADIADELVISPHTAKTHVSRIMGKLGVRDRAQVVVFAYESGLAS